MYDEIWPLKNLQHLAQFLDAIQSFAKSLPWQCLCVDKSVSQSINEIPSAHLQTTNKRRNVVFHHSKHSRINNNASLFLHATNSSRSLRSSSKRASHTRSRLVFRAHVCAGPRISRSRVKPGSIASLKSKMHTNLHTETSLFRANAIPRASTSRY